MPRPGRADRTEWIWIGSQGWRGLSKEMNIPCKVYLVTLGSKDKSKEEPPLTFILHTRALDKSFYPYLFCNSVLATLAVIVPHYSNIIWRTKEQMFHHNRCVNPEQKAAIIIPVSLFESAPVSVSTLPQTCVSSSGELPLCIRWRQSGGGRAKHAQGAALKPVSHFQGQTNTYREQTWLSHLP